MSSSVSINRVFRPTPKPSFMAHIKQLYKSLKRYIIHICSSIIYEYTPVLPADQQDLLLDFFRSINIDVMPSMIFDVKDRISTDRFLELAPTMKTCIDHMGIPCKIVISQQFKTFIEIILECIRLKIAEDCNIRIDVDSAALECEYTTNFLLFCHNKSFSSDININPHGHEPCKYTHSSGIIKLEAIIIEELHDIIHFIHIRLIHS